MKTETVEQLFTEHAQHVHRYLAAMAGKEEADDLLQETFLRALKSWSRFRGESAARTWLFAIARRTLADHLRRRRKRFDHVWSSGDESEAVGVEIAGGGVVNAFVQPQDFAERRDTLRTVWAAMEKLKSDDRQVIVLRVVQQLSGAETARILGWSEGRVAVRLHRALRALRAALALER
ncbi:MAG: RNA polymerase sigma factor [Bacilli bacterium]